MNLVHARARLAMALRARCTSVWFRPASRVLLIFAGLLVLARIGQAAITTASELPPSSALAAMNGPLPTTPPPAPSPRPLDAGLDAATHDHADPAIPMIELASIPVVTAPTTAISTTPIALNVATAEDLERLPGIGPKKAEGILALRAKLGRFHAVEDLLRVKGIGRKRLAKIRPMVTLDRT